MMDFHKEDQLKNMPQIVLCDTFCLLKQAVSSTKAPSQSKHRNELVLQVWSLLNFAIPSKANND